MARNATLGLGALAVAAFTALSSVYVVDERQTALVLQFGQIKQVRTDPGLGFKLPFIQDVVKYDARILALDTEEIVVTPSDDRRLVVDAFARYRIADPVAFRRAVGAGGTTVAAQRLSSILDSQIREVLGQDQVTSDTILSADRRALMNRIRDNAAASALALGLEVIDVRLKTTNLPEQNLNATFARMVAERQREAADERARGEEAALRVRAAADRTRVETVSEAQREAEITRGEADAEANRIFAEAYGADPDFFRFYRSMQAYRGALTGANATMVLSPNSEFFSYLTTQAGAGSGSGVRSLTGLAAEAESATQAAADATAQPADAGTGASTGDTATGDAEAQTSAPDGAGTGAGTDTETGAGTGTTEPVAP